MRRSTDSPGEDRRRGYVEGVRAGRHDWAEATRLVGRTAALATLRDTLAEVASGSSALLRVSGAAGLGKSRLTREALRLADESGFVTVVSRPTEHGEEVAFGAAVAALGPLLRDRDQPGRTRLVGDLPQLGLLFAGLELDPPAPLADAALQRLVLVEALCRLVDRLAREGPLVWVVDGLSKADLESAQLFQRLAVVLADRPVLLLVTDAEDMGAAASALDRACADCGWQRGRISLQPLADADAAALAEHLLGGAASERLRTAMRSRCAGIPLWITATAQALVDSGQLTDRDGQLDLADGTSLPLPADIDDQLRATVDGLDPAQQALLSAMSVSGVPLSSDVLWAAGSVDTAAAPRLLSGLERRRLVTSTGAGYDVAHGLLREVVLAHLTDVDRRLSHAALARALRTRDPDDPRIAEHVLAAGALAGGDLVPEELVRGARRARAVGATQDAYRYLSAALAASATGDREPASGAPLAADVAQAAADLGEQDTARVHWEAALDGYAAAGLAVGVARAHRSLADLEWARGRLGDAGRHLDLAEKALAGLEPGPELGQVYYARTVAAQRRTDAGAVQHEAARLRRLAGRIGSPGLTAQAQLAAAALAYARTDYAAALRLNDQALAAAEQAGDPALLVRVHDQTSVVAAAEGDLPRLRRHSRASLDLSESSGLTVLGRWPRGRLAHVELMTGNLDAALRISADLLAASDPALRGSVSLYAGHAILLTHQGHLPEARSFLERCLAAPREVLTADRNVSTILEYASVLLALAEGDPETATRDGARLAELSGGWMPLLGAALLAEAHVAAGRPGEATRIADRIRTVRSCTTSLPQTLVHWISGLAEGGHEHLAAAVDGFEALGLVPPADRARLQLAGTGATAVENPSRRRDPDSPLSPRELEVARWVGQGLSNAAVATALFISLRTVTTHLEHIYAKLGLSSRVALTRYLADSDLLEAKNA